MHLAPVLWTELGAWDASIQRRLYHGGLPEALRSEARQPTFYREWMDSFFARDIQRLFGFRDYARFDSLLEHVLRQGGGQLEKTRAVLEHIHAHLPDRRVHYWRDKAGHEVDFVVPRGRDAVDAIACKWDPAELDGRSLTAFRALHPSGANYLITPQTAPAWTRRVGQLEVQVGNPSLIGSTTPAP